MVCLHLFTEQCSVEIRVLGGGTTISVFPEEQSESHYGHGRTWRIMKSQVESSVSSEKQEWTQTVQAGQEWPEEEGLREEVQ